MRPLLSSCAPVNSSTAAAETIAEALGAHPQALHVLRQKFPLITSSDITLNLSACSRLSTPLAPSPDHTVDVSRAEFDPEFGARISHAESNSRSSSSPMSLIVGARLVGILVGTSHGTLAIQPASAFPFSANARTTNISILIAPAPPPYFRDAPVYVSDWRFLPAHRPARCPPMLEALSQDVHVLLPQCPPPSPSYVPLSPTFHFPPHTRVSFYANVNAKSPVFKSNSGSRQFLVEAAVPDVVAPVALIIVFKCQSVGWWPFIHPGHRLIFTALELSNAPAIRGHTVLRTTVNTSISTHHLSTTVPSQRSNCVETHSVIARRLTRPTISSGAIVSYEGTITHCFPSAILQLDDAVLLILAELDATIVGRHPYRTFRIGTRLRITNVVVVVRPSFPPRLIATGRSSIDILFFADIHAHSTVGCSIAQWRRLFCRLSPHRIAVVQEMFESLVLKFQQWFQAPSENTNQGSVHDIVSPGVIDALLGGRHQPGLVQYIMFLLGDGNDVISLDRLHNRIIYKEFTSLAPLGSNSFEKISLPTISVLRESVSLLWDDYILHQRRVFKNKHPEYNGLYTIFCYNSIVKSLPPYRRKESFGPRVSLVGLLDGAADGSGTLSISDASDSIIVKHIGFLSPNLMGALVCIQRFKIVSGTHVVVAHDQKSGGDTYTSFSSNVQVDLTVLFDVADVKVAVDGPYVQMSRGWAGNLATQESIGEMGTEEFQQKLSRSFIKYAPTTAISQNLQDGEDKDVSDAPLVCIYLERVRYGGQCGVSGRMIATMENRVDDVWTVVDNDGAGFWHCDIMLQGQLWLKLIACFEEGRLYAISCTQLKGKGDASTYINRKAREAHLAGRALTLSSILHNVTPWIENLGLGVYMRFVGRDRNSSECDFGGGLEMKDSIMSSEGERYMYVSKAVEQFRAEMFGPVESYLWKCYEWDDELKWPLDKTVHICGVVSDRQLAHELSSGSESCPVEKVSIIDENLGLFSVTVCFYDNFAQVNGLIYGMRIAMRNVVRVQLEGRRKGFEFIGNSTTSIRILSDTCLVKGKTRHSHALPRPLSQSTRCVCGNDGPPFWEVSKYLDIRFLDEFVRSGSEVVGLVRFYDARLEWIRMSIAVGKGTGCSECSVRTDQSDGCQERRVDVEIIVEVDDGSRVALFRCRGMGICMRVLAASHDEREAVRQLAQACGYLEVKASTGIISFLSFLAPPLRDAGRAVWQLLDGHRGSGGVFAAFNTSASRSCRMDSNDEGTLDKVVSKCFKFGYGRNLSVVCPSAQHRLMLEGVAFFEETLHIGNCNTNLTASPKAVQNSIQKVSPTLLMKSIWLQSH